MTADEFEARVEKLIADAREAGMSDEMMSGVLHDAAEALLKNRPDRKLQPRTSEVST